MATISTKTICTICKKSKIAYICQGCSEYFCLDHLSEHRKNLSQQLEQIQNDHDQLRQDVNEQKTDPKKHSLIKQIDQWEIDSINKIKEVAQQCRETFSNYSARILQGIEKKLNDFAQQLKEIHQENEFTELDVSHLEQRLQELQEELHQPRDVSIRQHPTAFIQKISLLKSFRKDTQWKELGMTVAGGKGQGMQLDQLSAPYGIRLENSDQTLYIADYGNACVVEWRSNASQGRIVAGGNGSGSRIDQLNEPADLVIDQKNDSFIIADRGNRRVIRWSRQTSSQGQIIISDIDCSRLAMHKDGTLYVSDYKKNEIRRWKKGETNGTKVAGGNGQGNGLNQLHNPTHIFVDDDHTLYISDRNNHRVMKWKKDAKEGVVVAGGNGRGKHTRQLSFPAGVMADQFSRIYVADMDNDRVMRWCEDAKEGTIIIGIHGKGEGANQLHYPIGLSFDDDGNIYVADLKNHRVQKFETD